MNFKKDLLIIDTEFTGFDLERHELIQLAAVLLDRKSLKEKKFFNSYIKPVKWKHRDPASMRVNKITWEQVKDAPKLKETIERFDREFDHSQVMLASYVGYADKKFLLHSYEKAGVKWRFDYHYFDIWSVVYAYLAKKNQLKSAKDFAGFGLEHLIKKFRLRSPALHDALVDCRVEAEVLRKVLEK